jgi:alpha-L-fucosidase
MLINTVALGGNLLMNVGPTGRGTFDERALSALKAYGEWMRLHERAIYGCTQSEFASPADVRFTQNYETNRLYVHVYAWPFRHIHLPGLAGKVAYAQLLNDASEVKFKEIKENPEWNESTQPVGTVTLEVPVIKPNVVLPVIEIFLK